MHFHHDGYHIGDPRIRTAARHDPDDLELVDEVDVLIVGTGPAGMILAAQLSQFAGITTRIIERRGHRLEVGQADGIACRSVETFHAFGFADRITAESYRITQTAFWQPDANDRTRIARSGHTPDDLHGRSEFPHLVSNQARVQDYFAEFMAESPTRMRPDYGWEFTGLSLPDDDQAAVEVEMRRTAGFSAGATHRVRARYVVGCDGARSAVREAIGRRLIGDSANHAWGVMDILATTDFPDVRLKSAIQSGDGGSILLIPREGGFLFRLYVDLGEVPADDAGAVRRTSAAESIEIARRILHPYTLEVHDIAWSSVYEVGQRVTDKFDDVPVEMTGTRSPRVFIAGDACHTHSAKAAQGMNVSMQDGFNLGWKLASVLEGRSTPALLDTYSAERQSIAQELIDFDREWSTIMATRPFDPQHPERGGVRADEIQDFYMRSGEFTAGFGTQYRPSVLTGDGAHQSLAPGYPIGRRFAAAEVMRVADANPLRLGHQARADGRWRLYVFADAGGDALRTWADWVTSSPSTAGEDFEVSVVYPAPYEAIDIGDVPRVFLPHVGRFDLVDYENVYALHPDLDIYATRGIDASRGCVVVVRPDQYVADVLPLQAPAALAAFFGPILRTATP